MPSDIAKQIVQQIFSDDKAAAIDSMNDALGSATYDAIQQQKIDFAKQMGFSLDDTGQDAADEVSAELPDGTAEPEDVEFDGRKPEDPPLEATADEPTETKPMKLITEEITAVDFLTEATEDGKKNYFIEGVFLQAELQNRNGRIRCQFCSAKLLNTMSLMLSLVVLWVNSVTDGPSINLDRVSHKIQSLKEDGNNFIGRAKILDTPMGKIARTFLTKV